MKIIAIGNAIVDILSQIDDKFLVKKKLTKGSMSLIDEETANDLTQIKITKIDSGGSAANTISTIAQLGIDSGFIGKVCNDEFGKEFINKIKKNNVNFLSNKYHNQNTAKSFILVTPDAQRTMCTYLGCASEIKNEDIDEEYFHNTQILYLEGYLWDKPQTIDALKKSIQIAKNKKIKIAFTASDIFCVKRHKQDFLELLNEIDILFANEAEFLELCGNTKFNNEDSLKFFNKFNELTVAITLGAKGCVVIENGNLSSYKPQHVLNLIDSTGAGDAFAAGFLYKILNKENTANAAQFGNLLAAKIIQKFGARFEESEIKQFKF